MSDFVPEFIDDKLYIQIIHYEDDDEFVESFPDHFAAHFSSCYPDLVAIGYKRVKSLAQLHTELRKAVGTQLPPIVIFDLRDDDAQDDDDDALYSGLTELEKRLQEFHEFNVVPIVYSAVLGEKLEKTGESTIYEYLVYNKKFTGITIAKKGARAGARELLETVDKEVERLLEPYIASPKGENIIGQEENPAVGFNVFVNDISVHRQPIDVKIGESYQLRIEMTVEDSAINNEGSLIGDKIDVAILCEDCEPEFQTNPFMIGKVGSKTQHTFTSRLSANSKPEREIKVMYYHDNYMLAIQYIKLNTVSE